MEESPYSSSLTTFSPSGQLKQIDYAGKAAESGQTSVGIRASSGVVIATEKELPSALMDEISVQKIQSITKSIGVAYSGMGPDSRLLVAKSRKQAQQYFCLYKVPIPVMELVREISAVMQEYTQSSGVRPFGISLLIAGHNENGPQLYQVNPSGYYYPCDLVAIGKNTSNALDFLERRYAGCTELEKAIHAAILAVNKGIKGLISPTNIEVGIVDADHIFRCAACGLSNAIMHERCMISHLVSHRPIELVKF